VELKKTWTNRTESKGWVSIFTLALLPVLICCAYPCDYPTTWTKL